MSFQEQLIQTKKGFARNPVLQGRAKDAKRNLMLEQKNIVQFDYSKHLRDIDLDQKVINEFVSKYFRYRNGAISRKGTVSIEAFLKKVTHQSYNGFSLTKKQASKIKQLFSLGHSLVVGKNSDKSTDAYREFIVKPYIKELALGAYMESLPDMATIVAPYKNESNNSVEIFGTRLLNIHGDFVRTQFSSYIGEYNLYTQRVLELSKTKFGMSTDISRYFQSFDHDQIADLLVKLNVTLTNDSVKKSIKAKLESLLEFNYTSLDGTIATKTQGITIESHYQHLIANMMLRDIMISVLDVISKLYENRFANINIVTYIDDIYIFGDSEDDVESVYEIIENVFKNYNLSLAEHKTSEVFEPGDTSHKKELVLLPRTAYFEDVITLEELDEVESAIKLRSVFEEKMDLVGLYQEFTPEKIQNIIDSAPSQDTETVVKWVKECLKEPLESMNKLNTNLQSLVVRSVNSLYPHNEVLCISYRQSDGTYDYNSSNSSVELYYYPIKQIISTKGVTKLTDDNVHLYRMIDTYRLSDTVLRLYNAQYWIDNRDQYIIQPSDAINKIKTMLDNLNNSDETILETLQFCYLVIINKDIDVIYRAELVYLLKRLGKFIVERFSNKGSFFAGILKKQLTEHEAQDVIVYLTSLKLSLRSYAYRYNHQNIIKTFDKGDSDKTKQLLCDTSSDVYEYFTPTASTSKDIAIAYIIYRYYRYDISHVVFE